MEASALIPGMRLEIFSQSSQMLFEAKVSRVLREDFAEIEREGEPEGSVPAEPQTVRIRGYNPRQNCGLWLSGELRRFSQGRDDLWVLEKLSVTGQDSGRTYSRQYITKARGAVRRAAAGGEGAPCTLSNLSLGGVAISTAERFEKGDQLLLEVKGRYGHEQPPLLCTVRRVTEQEDCFAYGCEFDESDPESESRIIKTVLEVQLMGMPRAVDMDQPLWH